MKIQVLLLAASLFAISASAQTKKIAHRSHSGSDIAFSSAGDEDNFGIYIKPDTSRHVVAPAQPDTAKTKSAAKTTKRKSTTRKKTK